MLFRSRGGLWWCVSWPVVETASSKCMRPLGVSRCRDLSSFLYSSRSGLDNPDFPHPHWLFPTKDERYRVIGPCPLRSLQCLAMRFRPTILCGSRLLLVRIPLRFVCATLMIWCVTVRRCGIISSHICRLSSTSSRIRSHDPYSLLCAID